MTASDYRIYLACAFFTSGLPAIVTGNYWLLVFGGLMVLICTISRAKAVSAAMKRKEL